MDLGIDGRTALVTGGGGRLGRQDCLDLAAEGADVLVLDVDEEAAQDVANEVNENDGGDAKPVVCDLTDRDEVSETVDEIRNETGGIDILINNAAMVDAVGKVESYDDELWDRDIEVNLTGTYNLTRAVFSGMLDREWGRIVNMSSMAGWYGGYGQLSYSTTKSGLIGFGKTLALEGASHNVTSNILAPNIVVGDLAGLSGEELEEINPQFERIRQATPMKTLGRESDVSNLVTYLCSEQAGYITGQVIGITGGVDLFTF